MEWINIYQLKYSLPIIATVALVSFLTTGCTGGRRSARLLDSNLTTEDVRVGTVARVEAATVVLATDQHVFRFEGGSSRTFTKCSGRVCAVSPTPAGLGAALEHARADSRADFGIRHFAQHLNGSLNFKPLAVADRGVPIVEGFGLQTGERAFNVKFYGGWLDDGVFFVNRTVRDVGGQPGGLATVFDASAVGVANHTVPTALRGMSGTWEGTMIGTDVSDTVTFGQFVRGDATLVIDDFADPSVDVAFSNLHDLETGARLDNRSIAAWEGIPLDGGSFGKKPAAGTDYIQGQFLGENHAGVTGVFQRSEVVGSFGADRQPGD
ncbi:MAG: hypothetical protein J4F40_19395 [Alphaproteobacteria bacterium]|nr:hypothetical protein [Alphaproteobacteria bacterium]